MPPDPPATPPSTLPVTPATPSGTIPVFVTNASEIGGQPGGTQVPGTGGLEEIRLQAMETPGSAVILPGMKKMAESYKAAFVKGFEGGDIGKIQKEMIDDAFVKGDKLYEHQQDLIRALGADSEAAQAMHKANIDMYNQSILVTGTIGEGEAEKPLRAFYSSIDEIQRLYKGIVNDDLLKTHFAVNTTAQIQAELPLYGRALGYRTSMVQNFIKRQFALTGKADEGLLKSTLAFSKAVEKSTGISSKIIAGNIGEMMEQVSLFGNMTEDEMARSAAAVAKLGIEMRSLTSITETFNNFEGAAEASAKLTQLTGVAFDSVEMMRMSNEGDKSAMLAYLKRQFDVGGIDVHSMSQPMLRAVKSALGVGDTDEVLKMFGEASNGLDSFLFDVDQGLGGVGPGNVDDALAESMSNIDRLNLLKGNVEQQMAGFHGILRDGITDAFAVTADQSKRELETLAFDVMGLQGEAIKSGVLNPMIKLFDLGISTLVSMLRDFVEKGNEILMEGGGIEEILKMGKEIEKANEAQEKLDKASVRQRTRLDRKLNVAESVQTGDPAQTQRMDFDINQAMDLEQLQAFAKADGRADTPEERRKIDELIKLMAQNFRDRDPTNDTVEIKISASDDQIVFTPSGGSPVTIDYTTE